MKARLIKRFEDEIAGLERELNHELPKEIQRARELGDLRENAEYQAAKERQRFVQARVSMLRSRVAEIQLMNLDRIPTRSRRLRLEADDSRERQAAGLRAGDAGGRRSRSRADLRRVAGRPRVRRQGGRATKCRRRRPPACATSRSSISSPFTTRNTDSW